MLMGSGILGLYWENENKMEKTIYWGYIAVIF